MWCGFSFFTQKMALVFQTHVAQLQPKGEQHKISERIWSAQKNQYNFTPLLISQQVHQFVETIVHNQISSIMDINISLLQPL
jgi:hypothetical protein